jgi:hypothetical protein
MSNRNFDNRVIIQRLQNKNYARNLYTNNVNGGRLINNPQNTDGNSSRQNTYTSGVQTEYFRGLLDGAKTVSLGGTFGISPFPLPTGPSATVPDSPTSVSAVGGNTQATVSFTAPVNDGGFAITGYTVTSDPDGITASGSSSPIIVTGLTNGTSYTFTVIATNSIGNSAPSDPSSAVTPISVPGSPTSVSAVAGNTQATVSFTAPINDGGSAITGYTVTSSPGGFTASGSSSPIIVTGLTNGISYTFTVVATNSAGNSAPSASSSPVVYVIIPGAPTSVAASPGDTDAIISFTAPVNDGGSPITVYTVTSSPGGFTATGSSSPILVSGLTNGTSYTFTVIATNIIGDSASSSPSSAVTPNPITDQIIASLTTSLSAYNAATINDWVQITSAEYTSLQTNVSGTNKAGISDAYMTLVNGAGLTTIDQSAIVYNTATANTPSIGANTYLYGFAVRYAANPPIPISNARVYTNTNTSSITGFNQVGSILPTLTTSGTGFIISYYVRKRAFVVNAGTAGLLAIFTGATTRSAHYLGFYQNFGVTNSMRYLLFTPGATGGIPNSSSVISGNLSGYGAFAIQGLTTATKQWA